jgi:DnaJ domain
MSSGLSQSVTACLKLFLSRPSAVDELCSLIIKAPKALEFRGIFAKDIKFAVKILRESEFWKNQIAPNGHGFKANRFLAVQDNTETEESDLDIGYSEDEVEEPAKPPSPLPKKRRLHRKVSNSSDKGTPKKPSRVFEPSSPDQKTPSPVKVTKPSKPKPRVAPENKENQKPSNFQAPRVTPQFPVSQPSAPPSQVTDWFSDFGRIIKQALKPGSPYSKLGLDDSCDVSEVKKRWSKLILLLHPDKAPKEWRGVKELADATQAINDAKRECEKLSQSRSISKPGKPQSASFNFSTGTQNNRILEVRWSPPATNCVLDQYLVQCTYPSSMTIATVQATSDVWCALSDTDARFSRLFTYDRIVLNIYGKNPAGLGDPLIVDIPLNANSQHASQSQMMIEKIFEGLLQQTPDVARQVIERFTLDQLKQLLSCDTAKRLCSPRPVPTPIGSKSELVAKLVGIIQK